MAATSDLSNRDSLSSDIDILLPWVSRTRLASPSWSRWRREAATDDSAETDEGGVPVFPPSDRPREDDTSCPPTRQPESAKALRQSSRAAKTPPSRLDIVHSGGQNPPQAVPVPQQEATANYPPEHADAAPAVPSYGMYYSRGKAFFVQVIPFEPAALPLPDDEKIRRLFSRRCHAAMSSLWTPETFPEFIFPPDFFTHGEIANLAVSVRGFKFALRTMCRMTVDFLYHVFQDMSYHKKRFPPTGDAAEKEVFYAYIREVRFSVLSHKVKTRKRPPQTGPGRYTPPQKLGHLSLEVMIKAIEGCIAAREAFLKKKVAEKGGSQGGGYLTLLDTGDEDVHAWLENSDSEDDDDPPEPPPKGKGKNTKKSERRALRDQAACTEMRRAVDRWIQFIRLELGLSP